MKVILSLLALCMIAPCLAEPQTITTGPYMISFDLGIPKDSYSVEVSEPETTESLGGDVSTEYRVVLILDAPRSIGITLTEYQDDQPKLTPSDLAMLARVSLEMPIMSDIQADNRKIDGVNGGIAFGKFKQIVDTYSMVYYPTARLKVSLLSFYSMDEGTMKLLKTIHVTKTV
jgi:hypothetical protein